MKNGKKLKEVLFAAHYIKLSRIRPMWASLKNKLLSICLIHF